MKVLQINSVCGYGSTGRIVTDLQEVLLKQGHQSKIFYGRGTAKSEHNAEKFGSRISFFLHLLKTRLLDIHGESSTKATKDMIERIKEYEPDIIHLHNIHGYYINIKLLFDYLATTKIPVVWLLHDQWAFSGHSAYFDLDSKGNIPKKNKSTLEKKKYPKSWFVDNSKRNYIAKEEIFTKMHNMTIVTPSNWLKEITKKSFLSKYPIKVIHNGIDLEVFRLRESSFKEEYGLHNKKIILGVASVWEERKGLKYFDLLASKLDESFQIVLVGIDKKNSKNINKKILIIERTSNIEELVDIYNSADVFLNPTLEDNFPTTNIEGLACGIPVITFDTGGSAEAIDSKTGITVKNKNVKELINAVKKITDTSFSSHDCTERAKKFDSKKKYIEYINLYKDILNS